MTPSPKLTKSLGVFAGILSPPQRQKALLEMYKANTGKTVVVPKPLFPDPQTHQVYYMPKVGSEMR